MSELSTSDVQQAVKTLETHFTRDEVELLKRDHGFMSGILLARFHQMAAEQRRRFIESKAEEIRAKIEMLRAANELNHLHLLLGTDNEGFAADLESAKQRREEATAAREAAQRKTLTSAQEDRIFQLELEFREKEALAKLETLGASSPAAPKERRKSREEEVNAKITKLQAAKEKVAEEMRTQGVSEETPYFRQQMNRFEAEINALRRTL